jgi:hypothetical protein
MKLLLFLIFITSISANNHKENDKYIEARELENIFYCINKESKQIDRFEFKEQQNSCDRYLPIRFNVKLKNSTLEWTVQMEAFVTEFALGCLKSYQPQSIKCQIIKRYGMK